MLHFEGNRVMMRCTSCGHDTPGWEISGQGPRLVTQAMPAGIMRLKPRLVLARAPSVYREDAQALLPCYALSTSKSSRRERVRDRAGTTSSVGHIFLDAVEACAAGSKEDRRQAGAPRTAASVQKLMPTASPAPDAAPRVDQAAAAWG